MTKKSVKKEAVTVNKVRINTAIAVHKQVSEFDKNYLDHFFEQRLVGRKHLITVAYLGKNPAGYMISYDDRDGSVYCWMAGVIPEFRRNCALHAMMGFLENWALKNGFSKVKIKTRNKWRGMLTYLVKNGFLFTKVDGYEDVGENRIYLEKDIRKDKI